MKKIICFGYVFDTHNSIPVNVIVLIREKLWLFSMFSYPSDSRESPKVLLHQSQSTWVQNFASLFQ